MKYIEQSITNEQDNVDTVHVVTDIIIRLFSKGTDPNSAFNQNGSIILQSWKNVAALVNCKAHGTQPIKVEVPDITQLQSYQALVTEVTGLILSDPRFEGANIKDTTIIEE